MCVSESKERQGIINPWKVQFFGSQSILQFPSTISFTCPKTDHISLHVLLQCPIHFLHLALFFRTVKEVYRRFALYCMSGNLSIDLKDLNSDQDYALES